MPWRKWQTYGVSTDYLLGRTDSSNPFHRIAESIDKDILPFLHDHPVFVNNNRWGLVDAINERILFLDGSELPFSDATRISALPPIFQSNSIPKGRKLSAMRLRHTPGFGWSLFPKMRISVRNARLVYGQRPI